MALSQRLQLRQTQSLVMTPQLLQAIKLLQLSHLDLSAYVEGELERNPLLERDAGEDNGPAEQPAEPEPIQNAAEGADEPWIADTLDTSRESIEARLDTDLENVFPDEGGPGASRLDDQKPAAYSEWSGVGSGGRDDDDYNLEAFVAAEVTLADHLAEQLALAVTDPAERLIGQYLLDMVNEAGYLAGDPAEVADKLGCPPERVEAVLEKLQAFNPSGVCARNLAECLAIQLKERDRFDPAMQALVANLDLLAKRDVAALKRKCAVSDEDIADMIGEIKRLDPKPGLRFGSAVVQPVVPDVFVRAAPDASWIIELNTDTLPKVLVNQTYYARVAGRTKKDTDKTYLSDCLQSAAWLVRALDQRAKTILKVATEIVRQQDAFLTQGVEHLRPLNLKTVADAIGMHESTVSRVTANKYMATPRGTFELKFFFTSAIAAANGGEAHSAEAVRHRIKQLIDAEAPNDVLSDDTIVEKLREAGIDIARRTVAKYREAMRIPSSVQRRREKQMRAAAV
ncbi:RNA polymerase sigma-54 factor RpoN [Rhodovulum sp. PH10]|uniref:RNA polymerase factor sigma-54 n=1 Tax=Rhodovulum sp. PH10 TaxID=1187851 RepID=UPI00027C249F|nr:RNA polymerase factor sigma-54 [Rhodovulum sp. PH10]EJW13085.1 RNA polymerase sigma-54 factor RpoN [Rhodovulum sp. PH10]